jgi:signal transduction histidine kinase
VFEEQPEQAKESLQAIQSTSTTALAELREMLDAFQPRSEGLQDIAVLADSVRAAGVPVQLVIDQPENALPGEIDQVAYRVVQEALTNVLRHAGPTTAQVSVRRQAGRVLVEVLDHGVGAADLHPGLGLAGMRKRVTSVAGELIAENHPGGGFRVSASLPVGEDLT